MLENDSFSEDSLARSCNPEASLLNPQTKRKKDETPEMVEIKDHILSSKNGTKYKFSIIGNNDTLHMTLIEDIEFCPFSYEQFFSLSDFVEHHLAFKSLDYLSQVNSHIDTLLKNNKISIDIEEDKIPDVVNINMKVKNISVEEMTKPFELKLKMTEDKDQNLIDLYRKQKKQIKILKNLKNLAENRLTKENPIYKEIYKTLCQTGYEL